MAALLADENKRFLTSSFVRPPAIVRCSIVLCLPRDWLQTTYLDARQMVDGVSLDQKPLEFWNLVNMNRYPF